MYIDPELIADETAAAEAVLAAFADRISSALGLEEGEEWAPAEGSPETSLAEAIGIVLATAMAMVQEQERNDFAGFGTLILRTPRQGAEPAEALSRWTFDLDGPHFIPDGSELVIDSANGTPVGFATVGDTNFTGTFADIPVSAIEPGAIANELVGLARDYEPLPHLESVAVTTPAFGGADDETRDEYLERITRRARLMKLVPIVTDDYADTAIDHPQVARAVAVRHLDLTTPTDPPSSPGHVTVFIADAAGQALGEQTRNEVRDSMMGEDRPLAVTVHVGGPTETPVTIAVSVRLATGADEPATVAAIQEAIAAAYNPATYGLNEEAPGRWSPPRSAAERVINHYDVTAVIDDIVGLERIEDVTVNGGESVTLNGWAPVPVLTGPAAVTVLT